MIKYKTKKSLINVSLIFMLYAFLVMLIPACRSNSTLLPRLSKNDVILAFGDSLTYGTGVSSENSYPVVLSKITGLKVISAGVPGETTGESLKRLPDLLNKYYPRLVILCIGGNDMLRKQSRQKTVDNIEQLIKMIRDHGSYVVLIAVPSPSLTLSAPDFYEEIGERYHVPVITSLLPSLLKVSKYKSDAVHLNVIGYRKFAEGIAKFLKEQGAL